VPVRVTTSRQIYHRVGCYLRHFQPLAFSPSTSFVSSFSYKRKVFPSEKKFNPNFPSLKYSHAISAIVTAEVPFSASLLVSAQCWQKSPLLVRGAFDIDNLADFFPTVDDILSLALEEDGESRIISHNLNDDSLYSYRLDHGPFDDDALDSFSTSRGDILETLVINDVDRHFPALSDFMYKYFLLEGTLPHWRADDGQVSLSFRDGASIGPHVDDYDVFLIQLSGKKAWEVERMEISYDEENSRSVAGSEVRVLKGWGVGHYGGVERNVLYPGDMLYLPPRFGHFGACVGDGPCMTLSVGWRAPSGSDLLSRLAEDASRAVADALSPVLSSEFVNASRNRYGEGRDLEQGVGMPGKINENAKVRAKVLIRNAVNALLEDDDCFNTWFGEFVTSPKRARIDYPIPLGEDYEERKMEPSVENSVKENLKSDQTGASIYNHVGCVWDYAESAVSAVLSGRGALYQAEGIAFAYSSVATSGKDGSGMVYRLFVGGLSWKTSSLQLLEAVANHRRVDATILKPIFTDGQEDSHGHSLLLLEELVGRGLLYGADEEEQ